MTEKLFIGGVYLGCVAALIYIVNIAMGIWQHCYCGAMQF